MIRFSADKSRQGETKGRNFGAEKVLRLKVAATRIEARTGCPVGYTQLLRRAADGRILAFRVGWLYYIPVSEVESIIKKVLEGEGF